jgi:hypothetical protein
MAGLEGSLRHALSAAEPGTVGVVSSDAVADEIGRRLAEVTPARSRVILFGSRARRDSRAHSDVDRTVSQRLEIEPQTT